MTAIKSAYNSNPHTCTTVTSTMHKINNKQVERY